MRGTPLPFQIFDDWGPHRRRICPLISNSLTIGYLSVLEYHTAFDAVPGEIYDLVAGVLVKELTIEQAKMCIRDSIGALRNSGIVVSFRRWSRGRLICLKSVDGVDDLATEKIVTIDPYE